MNYFTYRKGELYCEDVPIKEIVRAVGTPLYVYSYRTFERHFQVFDKAFRKIPHLVCYSCKANANGSLLRTINKLGGGADIVSGGELYKALRAGIPHNKIVFSGVGKTEEELRAAIKADILMINIESEGELAMLKKLSKNMKQKSARFHKGQPRDRPENTPLHHNGS